MHLRRVVKDQPGTKTVPLRIENQFNGTRTELKRRAPMFTPRRVCASSFLVLCLLSTAFAQGEQPGKPERPISQSSSTVTAAAAAERLRFTAPGSVVQMQLQIYNDSGQVMFDVTSKGNVLDWTLQDSGGERMDPGYYLCVVTVKSLSGKLSQRIGSALVHEREVELQRVDATQMTAPQQQAVGPIEENGALTILKAGETQATTVLANNGQEGQIIRDRGALSFRIGDFFSGNDKEQMRLTEEGNLGIGTAKPRVKLDVAGTVRAQQGFMFNDGSTLNVNEKGALILTARDGTVAPNTAGTGTQNHLAKWLETGGAGTLGDSGVTELANGFVGIGTTNPQVRLDVVDDTSGVGGFQLTNHTNGSTAQLQNRLANNTGAFAYYGITSSGYTQAPILSNRAFFGSYQVDTVIWTQTANDILFATNGLSAATERMRIKSSGNVGIGTNNPQSLLDVAGNLNVSGNATISGNIAAKYQDIAEWTAARGEVPAGTVVSLDVERTNSVRASQRAYDTRVAGVVSAKPGVILGEGGPNNALVATTGRVKVRVNADRAPIQIGDLLVTSNIPGEAMKSQPLRVHGRLDRKSTR